MNFSWFKLLCTTLKNGLEATFTIHLHLQLNGKPVEEKLRRWKSEIKLNKVINDWLICVCTLFMESMSLTEQKTIVTDLRIERLDY